jgi:hypothetical protein
MRESVEAVTSESSELTLSFVLFMLLATAIAGIGIITDSTVLVIERWLIVLGTLVRLVGGH